MWTYHECTFHGIPSFGTSKLALIFRLCCVVNTKVYSMRSPRKIVMYYISSAELKNAKKRERFVFLCGAFAIRQLKMTTDHIYGSLGKCFQRSTFAPYCDVSGNLSHNLPIFDCLIGFEKTTALGFFKFNELDTKGCKEEKIRTEQLKTSKRLHAFLRRNFFHS